MFRMLGLCETVISEHQRRFTVAKEFATFLEEVRPRNNTLRRHCAAPSLIGREAGKVIHKALGAFAACWCQGTAATLPLVTSISLPRGFIRSAGPLLAFKLLSAPLGKGSAQRTLPCNWLSFPVPAAVRPMRRRAPALPSIVSISDSVSWSSH